MKPDLNFSYLTKYVHGYLHEKTSITKRSRLSVALRDHNGIKPNLKLYVYELFSRDIFKTFNQDLRTNKSIISHEIIALSG